MSEISETEVLQFLALPNRWLTLRHEANSGNKKAEIVDATVSGGSKGREIKLEIFESLNKHRFIAPDGMETGSPTSRRYTITVLGRAHLETVKP